jgi:hypothetical protein
VSGTYLYLEAASVVHVLVSSAVCMCMCMCYMVQTTENKDAEWQKYEGMMCGIAQSLRAQY